MSRRVLRAVWIVAANVSVICFTLSRLWPSFGARAPADPEVLLELVLEFFFPAIGIVIELIGWKIARWVNVGYLVAAAGLWLGEALYWHRNAFVGVLLIIGVGMLVLAGITRNRLSRNDDQGPRLGRSWSHPFGPNWPLRASISPFSLFR